MRNFLLVASMLGSAAAFGQVVSSDGSLSYLYDFPLPPARGKYQPRLSLAYNSNAGTTAYGVGWSLTANYIDASSRATRNLDGTIRYRYVLVLDGSSRLLAAASDGSYRADVSQAYFSVTPSASLATAPLPNSWSGKDGMGNTYSYTCVGGPPCSRWYLGLVTDPDGNTTYFDYGNIEPHVCTGTANATALLTGIRYNFGTGAGANTPLHQVILTNTPSGSSQPEAINGCAVTHDQLLSSVAISRAQPGVASVSLGSWSLSYDSSPDTRRRRLTSIQPNDRGSPAAPLGPPAVFAYETNQTAGTVSPFNGPIVFTFGADNGLANLTYSQCMLWQGFVGGPDACTPLKVGTFIDIDGDGLPDLVWGGADYNLSPPACPTCPGSEPKVPGLRWARNLSRGNGTPVFSDVHIITGSEGWLGVVSAINSDGSTKSKPPPISKKASAIENRHIASTIGTLGATSKQLSGGTETQTLLMDFNGDGAPDLVSVGCGTDPTLPLLSVSFSQFDAAAPNQRSFGPPKCVDATAPWNMISAIYGLSLAADLPLVYRENGQRPSVGAAVPTHTWIQLVDFNGDGIADYIVVDKTTNLWHIFPGYLTATGSWAFSGPQSFVVTPIASIPSGTVPATAAPIRTTLGPVVGETLGGTVQVDLLDINGDGLPDRLVLATYTDPATGVQHDSWYVDYNTGRGFAAIPNGSLPVGMLQLDIPGRLGGGSDIAFVDMNRDGRPDLVMRSTYCGNAPATEWFQLFFNTGAGIPSLNAADPYGYCLNNPTGVTPFRPFDMFTDTAVGTPTAYNEGLHDIDGDGILDYVRAPASSETVPANNWLFYRGREQARRSDILTSVTTSTGLALSVHWAPSTNYGVTAGMPYVIDVVSALDQSGPAMSPLTTTYAYAGVQVKPMWDDPTGTQQEPLGFAQRFATPSVGGLTEQTNFGSDHVTAGLPTMTCVGSSSAPCSASSAPSNFDQTQTTWSTCNVGTACGTSTSYPTYVYASSQTKTHRDPASATAFSSTTSNVTLDQFGNVTSMSVTGDTLSSASTSVNISRAFATGVGSQCVACITEEAVTDPTSGTDLTHTFYHYDLPAGLSSNSRNPASVSLGHLSYVELLVSGSGPGGQYEVPQTTYFTANGAVSSVVKSYPLGQLISQLTESLTYDAVNGYDLVGRNLGDGADDNDVPVE